MRVRRKIALVGGVPIFIAAAIAVAGWFLLSQEERARSGAVLAGQIYYHVTLSRLVRDEYIAAGSFERQVYADSFEGLTMQAENGLGTLTNLARTNEQKNRIVSANDALTEYVAQMKNFIRATVESDGLIAEMGQRADTLIDLSDKARQRQQNSNADLVRSLSDKVDKLGATRDVVAGIYALQSVMANLALEIARSGREQPSAADADRLRSERWQFRNAARSLSANLRADGRNREANELDAFSSVDGSRGDTNIEQGFQVRTFSSAASSGRSLSEWGDRILKIDISGQGTLQEEVKQLLNYSIQANETEQATQGVALSTLKLGQRTANALARRDPEAATALLDEGERLSARTAALPISPLIQGDMIVAIDGWRTRLATTIVGLQRQSAMIADMDHITAMLSASARELNDAFIDDADRFGSFLRQILIVGAAAGLLAGSLAALAAARSITVPLHQLQSDMIALAADPSARTVAGMGRRDELGDIARTTTFFMDEIARREYALRQAKDRADQALVELHQVQDDLIRAEKLASLGQLVAGVAHEINTPLGIAFTTATIVRDETRAFQGLVDADQLSRSRLTHYVKRVGEGAHLVCSNLGRAADLVHGFKQVAVDRANDERRNFDLQIWLDDLLASLQPILRKDGHEVTSTCPRGLIVHTNPGALAQVVTNLITNAVIHGFADQRNGRITVRIEHSALDTVRLEITDDGRGILPENLSRIFDPFFTTARSRGSTGLGMHIVHNIVKVKLQGRIAVDSQCGEGTVVQIEFPVGTSATEPLRSPDEPEST